MSIPILQSVFKEPKLANEKTLAEYFLARAKQHAAAGRDYWLVDGLTGEKRFFSKFDEETQRIAGAFRRLGLQKGDVVIYMVRDLSKLPIILNGVWRANAITRASYPDDDLDTILYRVKECQVKIVVCEEDAAELCQNVASKVDWVVHVVTVKRNPFNLHSIEEFLEEENNVDDIAFPEITVDENDPAVILCTSGTTGLPKGAVHTHKSFLYMIQFWELFPFTYPRPNLIATKATHISGTSMELIVMASGKTSVVVSQPNQENIFKAAAKYKPGLAFAFPTFLVAMAGAQAADHDFSSIEVILTGGVPITPAIRSTLKKLPNVKDIVVAYGLTETVLCTTSVILKEDSEKETPSMRDLPDFSVGKPYPGTDLQIRDPETMEILGPGQQGEICVKTKGLFHSYLFNPEATEKAYVDGYFRTGDIGYFDGKTGFVYVVDRLKEIFKYYNDHISPTELENVIGRHPKVSEVCVIGLPDVGGHVPRAFITVHDNLSERNGLADEIKTFADANLPTYKQLKGGLYIVEELPKGKSGKITRQLVEKLPLPSL